MLESRNSHRRVPFLVRWELKEPASDNWPHRMGSPSIGLATSTWQTLPGIELKSWHPTATSLTSGRGPTPGSTGRAESQSDPITPFMLSTKAVRESLNSVLMDEC